MGNIENEKDDELMRDLIDALRQLQREDAEADERPVSEKRSARLVKVIFNEPTTVIKWSDGVDTSYKEEEGEFNARKSFEYCVLKKMIGEAKFAEWRETCNRIGNVINIKIKKGGEGYGIG